METIPLREILSDAIRYWELRRIAFNIVLALIVATLFILGLPGSRDKLSLDLVLGIFILAVLANVAYCAAYPVDVFAQLSSLRMTWLRMRWILFAVGLLFAGIITRYMAAGILGVEI